MDCLKIFLIYALKHYFDKKDLLNLARSSKYLRNILKEILEENEFIIYGFTFRLTMTHPIPDYYKGIVRKVDLKPGKCNFKKLLDGFDIYHAYCHFDIDNFDKNNWKYISTLPDFLLCYEAYCFDQNAHSWMMHDIVCLEDEIEEIKNLEFKEKYTSISYTVIINGEVEEIFIYENTFEEFKKKFYTKFNYVLKHDIITAIYIDVHYYHYKN